MQTSATLAADPDSVMASGEKNRDEAPILVVDDCLVSQRLAGCLIESGIGRTVIYAGDGAEALALVETSGPCLILTDLQMPVMDGLALVEAIRENHPLIPIVLMTAHGSEAIAFRALKAGAASYVPKDSLDAGLVDTLRQILLAVDGNRKRRQILSCQVARAGLFEIGNDPDLLPILIGLIQEDLLAFSIGDETARVRVAVALQEALSNALYHGNLECSTDLRQEDERIFYRLADERRGVEPYRSRRIRVELEIDRERARIVIRDEGPGFNDSDLDKPFDPEDLMRVGGRGMILVRTFLDEVFHNKRGNEITLIKRK
jgi:CheY-like chemotaxis protein